LPNGEPAESTEVERQRLGGLVARSDAPKLAGPASASKLEDLRAGDTYTGVVRVLRNWPPKEFEYQGRAGKVARALVSDGSKSLMLVAWHAQADALAVLERGAALRIEGGYAKARDEVLELHANERAKLSPAPPNEGPGEEAWALAYHWRKLSELREGEEALVKARLVELYNVQTFAKCTSCGQRSEGIFEKCSACSSPVRRVDLLAGRLDDGSAGYRLACFGSEARLLAGVSGMGSLDGLDSQVRERLVGKEIVLLVRPKSSPQGGFELTCVAVVRAAL